jgi:hypothetical protein
MKKTAILIFLSTLTLSVLAQLPTTMPTVACTSCTPIINSIVSDGLGGAYVGGTFTSIGGVVASNIAHITSTGAVDLNWLPNVTDGSGNVTNITSFVKTIVVYGQYVYIGGTFGQVKGTVFNNFSAIRVSNGQPINTILVERPINKLYLVNNSGTADIYIAAISNGLIGGVTTTVAKAIITLASQSPTQPALSMYNEATFNCDVNGPVNDLTVNGTTLYIAGDFLNVNSAPRTDVAFVSTTTGAPTALRNGKTGPNSLGTINAIEYFNGVLFLGGQNFSTFDGVVLHNNFVGLDVSNGNLLTAGAYGAIGTGATPTLFANRITDMEINSNVLYITGGFTTFNSLTAANGGDYIVSLQSISTLNYSLIPVSLTGVSSLNALINTISVASSSNMVIGGDFTSPTSTLTSLPYNQITFNALEAKTYGASTFNLIATSTSGLAISYVSSNPSVATISGNVVTILKAGLTDITASQSGATSVIQTLTVNKAALTITADNKSKAYNTANPALTITYSGFVNSETVANITAPSITTTAITTSNAGSYPINLTGGVSSNYNITLNNGILTVNKIAQTITFTTLVNNIIGDAAFNLTATSTSNLTIAYSSSNTSVATISGSTVTIVGVGSSTITASQGGNVNYNIATPVNQTLTVNSVPKTNQTITFGTLASKTIGDAAFNLTATSTSNLTVTYTSSNTSVATISGSTVTIVGVGNTIITASQAGNTTFNPAPSVDQTLTVNNVIVVPKTNQTITFNTLAFKTIGDAAFNLTATSTSSLTVTYTSSNPSVATIAGNVVTILSIGNTTITASQAGNTTFNPAPSVDQTLTVNNVIVVPKTNQTITFGTLASKTIGDAAFNLTATSTSGLDISYSSSNPSVATIAGNVVTIVGVGNTIITASQSGNTTYNPAPSVDQTLTVNDQIVTAVVDAERPTLSAYPNPTTDYINIQTASSKMKQIVILSINGRVMEQLTSSSESVEFNVASYDNGMYVVKISDEDNSATLKFIKK